jgi:hypothetical protein
MARAFLEVVPMSDYWLVRVPGNGVSEACSNKADAIRRARELGQRYDEWLVHVLTTSGVVETALSSLEASHTA